MERSFIRRIECVYRTEIARNNRRSKQNLVPEESQLLKKVETHPETFRSYISMSNQIVLISMITL